MHINTYMPKFSLHHETQNTQKKNNLFKTKGQQKHRAQAYQQKR